MGAVFFCFLHFGCIGLCLQISWARLCSLVEGFGPCSVRGQTPLCQEKPKLTTLLCRAQCRNQAMEGYIDLSADPTLYLQRNVCCCSDLSARETLAPSRPLERSSHGSLGAWRVMVGDHWVNIPGCLKCACLTGEEYFPITVLAEGKVYLRLSCCLSLPGPLRLWVCITHQLIGGPSKWFSFQRLLGFSLCLELIIVWLEDERMQWLI